MWKRLFVSLVLAILLISVGIAHEDHKEKKSDLSYSIEYSNYRFNSNDYLERYNYSKVPSYYVLDTMHFSVTITNTGKKTLKNLRVQAIQYSYPDVLLPGESQSEWTIDKLGKGESVTLNGTYFIPMESIPYAGLDNTRLIITKEKKQHNDNEDDEDDDDDSKDIKKSKTLVDDFFAGIWCPLAIFKSILPISP